MLSHSSPRTRGSPVDALRSSSTHARPATHQATTPACPPIGPPGKIEPRSRRVRPNIDGGRAAPGSNRRGHSPAGRRRGLFARPGPRSLVVAMAEG